MHICKLILLAPFVIILHLLAALFIIWVAILTEIGIDFIAYLFF